MIVPWLTENNIRADFWGLQKKDWSTAWKKNMYVKILVKAFFFTIMWHVQFIFKFFKNKLL